MTYAKQFVLGDLIDALADQDPTAYVLVESPDGDFRNPGRLDSYRGDYSKLMLEYDGESARTVADLLDELRDADGRTYQGYKGGDYTMDLGTPVFIDTYGRASQVCVASVDKSALGVLVKGFALADAW